MCQSSNRMKRKMDKMKIVSSWTVRNDLIVKRVVRGEDDFVYIIRINFKNNASQLRFPSKYLSAVKEWMESVWNNISQEFTTTDIKYDYKRKISSSEELASPDLLKNITLRIRPDFSSFFTLFIELWTTDEEDLREIMKQSFGQSWRDRHRFRCIRLDRDAFKDLIIVFAQLLKVKVE